MPEIHVIHENLAWLPPLAEALDRRGLPWTDWNLAHGTFDLAAAPPEGVFYNRMSASSHTRGHRHSAELTAGVLAWLRRHGRRLVNGPAALDLEISKARQYAALELAGVPTPRTVLVLGDSSQVADAARAHFPAGPVILKPNRGGKGLGVRLLAGAGALAAHLAALPADEHPADGLWLLQEHVAAARPLITRAEFVGGRFLYTVEVETAGGFELCPADACAVGDVPAPSFRVLPEGIEPDLRARLEGFLRANGTEVAGIEFIRAADGRVLTYDVNTNTNYNPAAEAAAGLAGTDRSGPGAIAAFLGAELAASTARAA